MSVNCINAVAVGALIMRRWCVAALVVAPAMVSPASSAVPIPQEVVPNVDACVARLDPQLDIGYDRIAARCPDLMKQLETGAWAPWLPRGWKDSGNDLSAGSLKELRELVARESSTRETNPAAAPDVRNLKAILTTLAGDRNQTGWSRFKSWLRSVLERREQPTDDSWLSRMVAHAGLSQAVIRLISYAALGAVVILAAIIVINELRTAGLFGKAKGAGRRRQTRPSGGGAAVSWSDIEQAAIRDRPRLLLELVVRRLSARGALPPAGALTVRELTQAVQLPEAEDRSRLAELALAAERVRYSALQPEAARLEEPLVRGRELLSRLDDGVVPDASVTR